VEAQKNASQYLDELALGKKNPGEWRGCLDARPVNKVLRHKHFKMEGLHTACQLIRSDNWMTTLDITEAYPHLLISPAQCQYFQFVWEGGVSDIVTIFLKHAFSPMVYH